jgi:hypothetical protein
MATYAEVNQVYGNAEFHEKIIVACHDLAQDRITDHANQDPSTLRIALRLLRSDTSTIDAIKRHLVMVNITLTVAQILGVNDATIKTAVSTAVSQLIAAETKAGT